MNNSPFYQISISLDYLLNDFNSFLFIYDFILLHELWKVTPRAIFSYDVVEFLCLVSIKTSDYIRVKQRFIHFDLIFKQTLFLLVELVKINYFDGIFLSFFLKMRSFINFAAVTSSQEISLGIDIWAYFSGTLVKILITFLYPFLYSIRSRGNFGLNLLGYIFFGKVSDHIILYKLKIQLV